MSNVIPFDFNGAAIRVITGADGEPWFVARDVAELLGYSNPQKAVRDHCKANRPLGVNETFTLDQQTVIIPERDVYRLVMRSKMPEAEQFEEWVVGEVLPSIRKTGSYSMQPVELSRMDILQLAMQSEEERLRLEQENRALEHRIEKEAPRVAFAKQVEISQDAISVAQAAKILGTGQRRLFAFLRQISWISRRNEPYQAKIETGYLDVKLGSFQHPDHGLQQSVTTLVTGKGLTKLQQLWSQHAKREAA